MPNWAFGTATITGTESSVIKFVNRFIFDGDEDRDYENREQKYFARSFTNNLHDDVLKKLAEVFCGLSADDTGVFELPVDFAWSAQNCLIDGYPQDYPDYCITLSTACIEDQVSVEITTEEEDMSFREFINCDNQGQLSSNCKCIMPCKCRNCGSIFGLVSFNDAYKYSCYECGEVGLDPVEEDAELE